MRLDKHIKVEGSELEEFNHAETAAHDVQQPITAAVKDDERPKQQNGPAVANTDEDDSILTHEQTPLSIDQISNVRSMFPKGRCENDELVDIPELSKMAILRTLTAMCGSTVVFYSAYLSFENLQSSINQDQGLGTTSVAVMYASFILSLLLVSHVTVSVFSYKWIYVVSMIAFLPFFATGFYPTWATMIPAALLAGLEAQNPYNTVNTSMVILTDPKEKSTNEEIVDLPVTSKVEALRNLAAMCGSTVLFFSAYLSIENLQSSINQHQGLGTASVAVLYASFILFILLVSHMTVSVFSYKWIYVVSMTATLPYFATGFYPTWSTMIPAALMSGFGAANFWNAQQGFLNDIAVSFSKVSRMDQTAAVNLFCGIYYGCFFSAKVWGNLVSALVLRSPSNTDLQTPSLNVSRNHSFFASNNTPTRFLCGADFCSIDPSSESAVPRPSDDKIYIYTGVCVAMGTLGVLTAAGLLTKTPVTVSREKNWMTMMNRVILHLAKCRDQKILIIPTMLRGMTQAFMNADVTIAFISCILGVEYVGWIMITYGVVGSLVSVIIGRLSKYSGWYPFFVLAFVLQVSLCIAFLLIEPDPERPYLIFILASLWAVVEAIFTPSIPAIHSNHFEDKTAAISSYRVLDSLGFVLTFGYSSALCMRYKIYIMIGMATASIISLSWFNWISRERNSPIEEVRTNDDEA